MKRIGIFFAIFLIIIPSVSFANELTSKEINDNENLQLLQNTDAFDEQKERELLLEMVPDGEIILEEDNPLVLEFDDGSTIEYSVEFFDDVGLFSTERVIAKKTYNYLVARAEVIMDHSFTVSGQSVTITSLSTGISGVWLGDHNSSYKIIRKNGYGASLATAEFSGNFTLRAPGVDDYYVKHYILQTTIDPALKRVRVSVIN